MTVVYSIYIITSQVVQSLKTGDLTEFQRLISTFKTVNPVSVATANPISPNYLKNLTDSEDLILETILDEDWPYAKTKNYKFLSPIKLPDHLYVPHYFYVLCVLWNIISSFTIYPN